jgi:Epoxide hydrolase N terminus
MPYQAYFRGGAVGWRRQEAPKEAKQYSLSGGSRKVLKGDTVTQTSAAQPSGELAADNAIRPFHVDVPEAELTELRRRIKATKWPERETVTDGSQGVQLATIQKLARYWGDRLGLAQVPGETERSAAIHHPRSMRWRFISFTFVRNMTMRCRSLSRTDGPARSSSS